MAASLREQRARQEAAAPERGGDLLSLLGVAMRDWPLVLAVAVASVALAHVWLTHVAVPRYTATATVVLESRPEQVVDLQAVVPGLGSDATQVNTEARVLRSRALAGRVVDALDLGADPEFNPALTAGPAWLAALRRAINPLARPPMSEAETREAVIRRLLRAVRVNNPRQSLVFEISVTTRDAAKAARIADAFAEHYVASQIEVKFARTEAATAWLSRRVAELKDELEAAEAKVKDLDARTDLVSPAALAALSRQLKELRGRRDEVAARLAAIAERRQALEAAGARGQARAVARLDAEAARLEEQAAGIDEAIAELQGRIRAQSDDLVALDQLKREAEASRQIYEFFLNRLKETRVQRGTQQADSRVLSAAMVPLEPSSPRAPVVLVLAGLAGLGLGAAAAIARELRQTAFRTADELERATGRLVIGQIPAISRKGRSKVLAEVTERPASALAEAVRNLRTSLMLADPDHPPKVVMVCSSEPAEGKTTLAILLAHNMAGMGRRVLLIEGDMRRRVFAEVFGAAPAGLASVLAGEARFGEALKREVAPGLDVLLADEARINAADLYASAAFAAFLDRCARHYDHIVIDTPPVLAVPDARIISRHADSVVFAVRWNATGGPQLRRALQEFEAVGARIAGLVLTRVDARAQRRYGYGGSYDRYYQG